MGKGRINQITKKNVNVVMKSKELLKSKSQKCNILKLQSKKKVKMKKKKRKDKELMMKQNENSVDDHSNEETLAISGEKSSPKGVTSSIFDERNADKEKLDNSNSGICNIAYKETNCIEQAELHSEPMEVKETESENYKEDEKIQKSIVRFIKLSDCVNREYYGILFLEMNQEVAIKGYGELASLCGQCECYGYVMDGNTQHFTKYMKWFSPTSSSLLSIKALSSTPLNSNGRTKLLKLLKHLSIPSKQFSDIDICRMACCVLFKKSKSHKPLFLKMFNNFQGFPTNDIQVLGKPFTAERVYSTGSWKQVLQKIASNRKLVENLCHCSIMVCGGTDVGKSSFAKYVINDNLTRYDTVYYLECDCGQTEFTPPAVLSLVKITKPLLGPSYTHSVSIEKSYFFGHISPKEDPQEYSRIIESIFIHYHQNYADRFPLIINQHGWIKGLGLHLLLDSLRIISPCFVAQIQSSTMQSRNLEEVLSDHFCKNQKGWSMAPDYRSVSEKRHSCTYIKMMGIEEEKCKRSSKGSTSRNLNVSSYFSDLYKNSFQFAFEKDWISPSLSTMPPYKISWDKVAIHVMHENIPNDVMLLALNMALVCLAKVDDDLIKIHSGNKESPKFFHSKPLAEYIGMGIVRNIDIANKLFYILTPEPMEKLNEVNAIIRGNVELPSGFFHQNNSGCSTYLTSGSIGSISKFARKAKVRFNLKRKPSKMKNSMEVS